MSATDRPLETTDAVDGSDDTGPDEARSVGVGFAAAVLLVVPALAGILAVASAWRYPVQVGDAAWLTQRVADVGAGRWPLVGMPSTIGGAELATNHPGPVEFYWLSPFWELLDSRGIGIGVAVSGALAVFWIGWTTRLLRGASLLAAVGAQVAVTVGIFTVGPETFADPWNPYVALPWAMLLLVASVRVWGGDQRGWPAVTVAASVAVQLHAGYVPWVALVLLVLGVRLWFDRPAAPRGRNLWITLGALLVIWTPPLADLAVGDANAVLLARVAGGSTTEPAGFGPVVVAASEALSPLHRPLDAAWIATDVRARELLVVIAVLLIAAVSAWVAPRRSWQRTWVAATTLGAVAWMLISTRAPLATDVLPHSYVRPLWPIGAAMWFGVGAAWWARRPPVLAGATWIPVLVMAVWAVTVPRGYVGIDPAARTRGAEMVEALASTASPEDGVTVVASSPIGSVWLAPALTAELDRRSTPSGVGTDEDLDAPWMSTRPSPLDDVDCRWIVGDAPDSGTRLVAPRTTTASELARLAELRAQLSSRYPTLRPSRVTAMRQRVTGRSPLADEPVEVVLQDGRFAQYVVGGDLADATMRDPQVREYVELARLDDPLYSSASVTASGCGPTS